jgi:hypothetical protein
VRPNGPALRAALAPLLVAAGCSKPPAKASQLIVGDVGSFIVNSVRPTPIAVRVLDDNGQPLATNGVRFRWASGDALAVADAGTVTCTHSADAFVRASLDKLEAKALIRCRPVKSVHIPGPMQFHVGDTAVAIPVDARDFSGKPVSLLSGTADIIDTVVAVLDGFRVRPRKPGSTVVGVRIGDRTTGVGVHVYEPVSTLDGLRPEQKFVSVPVTLSGGTTVSWHLPPGNWMLTMMPYEDELRGLRLQVKGANCSRLAISPRRYGCVAGKSDLVTVSHPSADRSAPKMSGELLVFRMPGEN